jgi:hypothetical protein
LLSGGQHRRCRWQRQIYARSLEMAELGRPGSMVLDPAGPSTLYCWRPCSTISQRSVTQAATGIRGVVADDGTNEGHFLRSWLRRR